MDLIEFARGPAFEFALAIFCLGVVWRCTAIVLLRQRAVSSEARLGKAAALRTGMAVIGTRSWPHREFMPRTGATEALGYAHHIGLFVIILAFAPHIELFHALLGLRWPAMPSSLITIVAVLTITLLLVVLFRRLTHPVMRRLSNFDDYFTLFITLAAVGTGLLATAHVGARYETLLGLHILSIDLMMIWFPFGKLMHAFFIVPSRAINGYVLSRKGAAS